MDDINILGPQDLENPDPFDTANTYDEDLPLFLQLGLSPFKVKAHADVNCGTVRIGTRAIVDVSAHCMPAQFWTFVIHLKQPKRRLTLSTGSGLLSEYWPIIEKFADGMIAVDEYLRKADE